MSASNVDISQLKWLTHVQYTSNINLINEKKMRKKIIIAIVEREQCDTLHR
jgi:hypothetical protein